MTARTARALVRTRTVVPTGADVFVVSVAIALKLAFTGANADTLAWLITPSARLAGVLADLHLVPEAHVGYLSFDPPMIVGAPCAGANFLVIAWLALHLAARDRVDAVLPPTSWLVRAVTAYAVTVGSNAVRIALSAAQLREPWTAFGMRHEDAHRLLGVLVYLASLIVVCAAYRPPRTGESPRIADAVGRVGAVYVVVELVLPIAHHGLGALSPRFVAHVATVVAAVAVAWSFGRVADRLRSSARPAAAP